MGLISFSGSKTAKGDKPMLRITRSFPIFGKRTVMLYFPESVGAGFSYLPLVNLVDSRVFVTPEPVLTQDVLPGAEAPRFFEVRSSRMKDPIIVMKTQDQAADVVRRLSEAICPKRMKWVWWTLAAVVVISMMPSGASVPVLSQASSALSIHTPIVPRAASVVASPPPNSAAVAPAAQSPAAMAAQAPASLPNQKPDQDDPFGLKIVPTGN